MSKFAEYGIHYWNGVYLGAKEVYPTKEEFLHAVKLEALERYNTSVDGHTTDILPQIEDALVWWCVCSWWEEPGGHYHAEQEEYAQRDFPRQRGMIKAWKLGEWE